MGGGLVIMEKKMETTSQWWGIYWVQSPVKDTWAKLLTGGLKGFRI